MRADRVRIALPIALIASLGLHAGVLRGLAAFDFDVDVGFELELPAEIEFGITESMEAASAPAVAAAPASAPPQGAPPVDGTSPEARERDRRAQTDAGTPEAAPTDAGTEPQPNEPSEGPLVAEPAPSSVDGPTSLPPGAQLAMRLDMQRIARSPLAPAVREFFRRVPDWHLIVHGSEIDPLTDLDRLFLATPDPRRRSELVIAGRVMGGQAEIRQAVEHMAASRGQPAPWRRAQNLNVADWRNLDQTERVMALLGPRQFAIAREEVLPTLVAMIRHRGEQARSEGLDAAEGADALLSMGPNDALTLEVEGIHRYVRGRTEHLPSRARLAVGEGPPGRIAVEGLAFFGSAEEATAAQPHWDNLRQQLARHPMLRLLGMASVLDRATLVAEGDRIRIRTELTVGQAQQVLNYIGAQIAAMTGYTPPPLPAPAAAPAGDSTPAPTQAPAP